jgi:hypothetical protein
MSKKHKAGRGSRFVPNYANRQIFNVTEEMQLTEFLLISSKMYHGLSPKSARSLAYEFAVEKNKTVPSNWTENKMAGVEWIRGLMKRNTSLSIRKPEAYKFSQSHWIQSVQCEDVF